MANIKISVPSLPEVIDTDRRRRPNNSPKGKRITVQPSPNEYESIKRAAHDRKLGLGPYLLWLHEESNTVGE